MTLVDRYLDDLARALPGDPLLRRRVLSEAESHLRELAAEVGEEEAVARFGPSAAVAAGFAEAAARRSAVAAALALTAALAALVVAYGASENTLPPAPWPSADATPGYLRWKAEAAGAAFAVGGAATVCALLLAWLRRARLSLGAAAAAALALAASAALAATHHLQRTLAYEELGVPGTEPVWLVAAAALVLAAPVAASVGAAAWALRVASTARRASRS